MRRNTEDTTLKRNYIQKWRFLIQEYELTKAKQHPHFRFVSDFYKHHHTCRQSFLKYYNRFKVNRQEGQLLPQNEVPDGRREGRYPSLSKR